MKKGFLALLIFLVLSVGISTFAQDEPQLSSKPDIIMAPDCSVLTWFGTLCQDTDDGKVYKWNGATQVELASGTSGDMTYAEYDIGHDGKIDVAAGGTGITTAGLTGTPYVTAGAWSVKNAAAEMTALGFTANAQTLIASTFAQMQASLSIDDLITLSGVVEGSAHLATFTGTTIADNQTNKQALQALETAVEGKQTTDATLTALAGLTIADVSIIEGTGADAFNVVASAGNNYILGSNAGNTALEFKTPANVLSQIGAQATHANLTALSPAGNWKVFYSNGTGVVTEVALDVAGTVLMSNGVDQAPTMQAPSGAGDVTGVGDCESGACLDGSSDGGTYIALYDGGSNYTKITAGNSIADLTFTLPTAYPGASDYLLKVSDAGVLGYTAPSTFQTADATLTALAGFTGADVTIIEFTAADAVNPVTSGGAYRYLGSNSDNTALTFQALDLDRIADSATYQKIAATDVNATNHVTVLTDIDDTGGITITGLSATRAITVDDAAQTLAARNRDNTFTENNTFGNTDTDTITLRSLLVGGNSRAVWIADSAPTPTYSTGTTDLYVKRYIESAGGMYAPYFDSVLTAGNVGYIRMKEDPTNGTNFRGFSVVSTLTQDLTFTLPDGNPSANQILLLGAATGNVSAISYGTFSTGDFLVSGGSITIKSLGVDIGQINATGSPSAGNYLRGDGTWNAPSSAAYGSDNEIQYAISGALSAEAAFTYNPSTNTLTANNIVGDLTGNVAGNAATASNLAVTSQAQGDLFTGATGTTLARIAAVAAGQPLLSGGLTTAPAYAGYTFSGTAAQTYTFPTVTASLAPLVSPVFSTSLALPQGDNPTTDAAGEIAMDTTAGAIQGLNVYANATPGAIRVPFYYMASPVTVKDPTSSSDYHYLFTPYAITLRSVHYLAVGGTSWTGQLQICDANGSSCADTQVADTTAAAGTTTNVTSFSDATVPAGVWMYVKTQSVDGSPTAITVQADFTVDQQ